jgi:hypothetical protein
MDNQTQMQPHQQRVVDEKAETQAFLDTTRERANKLKAFLGTSTFNGLSLDEQGRLFRQHAIMTTTIFCLTELAVLLEARIENF